LIYFDLFDTLLTLHKSNSGEKMDLILATVFLVSITVAFGLSD